MKFKIIIGLLMLVVIVSACNPEPCERSKEQTSKDYCYLEKAKAENDASICDNIKTIKIKTSCLAEIGIINEDIALCDSIEGLSKEFCKAKIAESTTDSKICKEIEDVYWKDVCFKNVAIKSMDYNLCGAIFNNDVVDDCLTELRDVVNDSGICFNFISIIKVDNCYRHYALQNEDPELCKEMSEPINRDGNCYKPLAEKMNDAAICNKIRNSEIKKACLEKLEEITS